MHVQSFIVCVVGKMEKMYGWCESIVVSFLSYCLFGFWGVPSLHVLVFIQKSLLWLVSIVLLIFRNGKKERREVGGEAEEKVHGL